jgi:hypothetical protein
VQGVKTEHETQAATAVTNILITENNSKHISEDE